MLTATVIRGVARGLHMAGCFSLFGTCLAVAVVLPPVEAGTLRRGLDRLAWGSFALLLLGGAAWFALQTADMAGAETWADMRAAVPVVAAGTRFGALLIGRMAVLAVAMLLFRLRLAKPAAILAGGAVMAEAWLGHGGAMTGAVGDMLLASLIVHLASGGAWLGALPALRLGLRYLPVADAAGAAARFSPIGLGCVLGLTGSAALQFLFLIGGPAALFDNAYGLVAAVKTGLFLLLIGLAAVNRYRFTPGLAGGDEDAGTWLRRSVGFEIAVGVVVVLAAGFLLQLTPPSMAGMAGGS